jgi:hypothetical protein
MNVVYFRIVNSGSFDTNGNDVNDYTTQPDLQTWFDDNPDITITSMKTTDALITITYQTGGAPSSENVDGGRSDSIYAATAIIDGGGA